ncbi:MAG: cupin domain-containing protein [Bacteroidetes bacterium]|nr:cupin domain-containing protein [Bacteroidota bacterium]
MNEVIKPIVRVLASGDNLVAKEMSGKKDKFLPKHSSNMESVIFIHEGECIFILDEKEIFLKAGEAHIVPPGIKHQFKGITDFKGIHFMPKEIEFEFFD